MQPAQSAQDAATIKTELRSDSERSVLLPRNTSEKANANDALSVMHEARAGMHRPDSGSALTGLEPARSANAAELPVGAKPRNNGRCTRIGGGCAVSTARVYSDGTGVGRTQLRALLRHGWHAAHASAGPQENSEAATDPCKRVQPEPDPAATDGGRHSAGVEKPRWAASFAGLFAASAPGRPETAVPEWNFTLLHEKLRDTAEPATPLAVPEISYLHHRLIGPFFSESIKKLILT